MKSNGKKKSISIGIPAYNRPKGLENLFLEIQKIKPKDYDLNILIIDDSDNQKTHNTINELANSLLNKTNHKIIKNQQNLGYPRTYLRLFEECQTDYIMIIADDDSIIEYGLNNAVNFIYQKSADLVSPQWLLKEKVHRGMTETRPIKITEFIGCSGHAPGLIYKTKEAKKHLQKLNSLLDKQCAFTSTYPQTVLCLHLLLENKACYWLDFATACSGSALPSGIKDPYGNGYWTYTSRLRQAASIDEILYSFEDTPDRNDAIKTARLSFISKIYRASGSETKKIFAKSFSLSSKIQSKIYKYIINPAKKCIRKSF